MTVAPKRYRTLRELVQEQIIEDIVKGRLVPGDRIVETELSETYGVSRGPIREALRDLGGQGLVVFESNRGAYVATLTRKQIRELYEIRLELEALAARLGAATAGEDTVRKMAELLEQMHASIDEPREWLRLNNAFHLTLYEASGRSLLCTLIRDLMTKMSLYLHLHAELSGQLADIQDEHRLLVAAVQNGDPETAAEITRRHMAAAVSLITSFGVPEPDSPADGP
jgi:DNA-binding GntR family transcriptional regulator